MVDTTWIAPLLSVIVTVTTLPPDALVSPLINGVVSAVLSGASTIIVNAGLFSPPEDPPAAAIAAKGNKANNHNGLGIQKASEIASPPNA